MSAFQQDGRNGAAGADSSNESSDQRKDADYQVGYKRPPVTSRFKPGQSGNPKGRPKGASNHRTTIDKVMKEKVSIREGDKIRRVTKFEALLQAQANKGIKGDARGAGTVISLMAKTGLLDDKVEPIKAKQSPAEAAAAAIEASLPDRPGDIFFDGVDIGLLTDDEAVELSGLAEYFDQCGIGGLNTAQFERIKQLTLKAKVAERAAA
jgi:hypothetical protein